MATACVRLREVETSRLTTGAPASYCASPPNGPSRGPASPIGPLHPFGVSSERPPATAPSGAPVNTRKLSFLLAFLSVSAQAQAQALPPGWPTRLELGMADGPGGAAAMKGDGPVRLPLPVPGRRCEHREGLGHLEYQRRLRAVLYRGLDRQRHRPGLHLLHAAAVLARRRQRERRGLHEPEQHRHDDGVLQRPETLLPEGRRLPAQKVVLHVEPDLWGYMEQRADERRRAGPCPRRWRKPGFRNWRACRATCRALPAPSSSSATRMRPT